MKKSPPKIRPICANDSPRMERVIRQVMPEFGASGEGFAIQDPEVKDMAKAYKRRRTAYFVVEQDGHVVGGAGIAPLAGGERTTCELQKMYLVPEARALGIGQSLIEMCIEIARKKGFNKMYLETLEHMKAARRLYEKNGFYRLGSPKGDTGHFGCNCWYEKEI